MKQVKNLIKLLEYIDNGDLLCEQLDDKRLCGDISCVNCPLYSDETFSDLLQELKEVTEGDPQ